MSGRDLATSGVCVSPVLVLWGEVRVSHLY